MKEKDNEIKRLENLLTAESKESTERFKRIIDMEEKIVMFKVTYDGTYCLVYTLNDAIDTLKYELEQEDCFGKIEVERVEMTQEEIDALPEFEGF